MSKVVAYTYKSRDGNKPSAVISHEQYDDGSNMFLTFLPESNETKSFHILSNAEKFLYENGFITTENVEKSDDIPAKTLKELTEEYSSVSTSHTFGKNKVNDSITSFGKALIQKNKLPVDEVKSAQRRAIFDLTYSNKSPFSNEKMARDFLSTNGDKLASSYKNVLSHPEFKSMVSSFGKKPMPLEEGLYVEGLSEATAPGMEDWVISNKKKFTDEYGKEKGLKILYATAWKLHDKKVNESQSLDEDYVIDRIEHPKYGTVEWKNELGYHTISSKNKETGAQVIHALGKHQDIAKKWKTVKERLLKESDEWATVGGFEQLAESIAATYKE